MFLQQKVHPASQSVSLAEPQCLLRVWRLMAKPNAESEGGEGGGAGEKIKCVRVSSLPQQR